MARQFMVGFGIALLVAVSTAVGAQEQRSTGPRLSPSRPGTVTIGVPTGSEPRLVVATDTEQRFEAQAQAVAVTYSATGMKVTMQSGSYTITDLKSGRQTAQEKFSDVMLLFGLNGGLADIAKPMYR